MELLLCDETFFFVKIEKSCRQHNNSLKDKTVSFNILRLKLRSYCYCLSNLQQKNEHEQYMWLFFKKVLPRKLVYSVSSGPLFYDFIVPQEDLAKLPEVNVFVLPLVFCIQVFGGTPAPTHSAQKSASCDEQNVTGNTNLSKITIFASNQVKQICFCVTCVGSDCQGEGSCGSIQVLSSRDP